MDANKYADIVLNVCSDKFEKFVVLLSECNKIHNLTAITDEKGMLYKHFIDSLAGESFFKNGARVVEIGSGGGFPSVPLMIMREDLRFTLIESTGKKYAFLREAVDKLGLNCEQVLNIRAEDGAHNAVLREKFDCACARAVAPLNVLCEYCLPYVRVGGRMIAYKGDVAEELAAAANAVKILGGEIERTVRYELPENYGSRNLVIIRKIKNTPEKYPRGNGKERKNPL